MMRNVRSTANGVCRTNIQDTMRISTSASTKPVARRKHDGGDGLQQARPDNRADAGLCNAGADQPADQRVRTADGMP